MVCVGDPAQCEPIGDRSLIYNDLHKETATKQSAQKVILSNRGLELYSQFDKVVILTSVHRVNVIANPKNDEEEEYNERAKKFLDVLHRLRNLQLTPADYNWLCKMKKAAINSLSEKAKFLNAPVLMDFRKATVENPEKNCEYHNLMRLRASAREHKVPIVRITATYDGLIWMLGVRRAGMGLCMM